MRLTRLQMCSKDRDAARNIAESENRARRHLIDVVVWSHHLQEAGIGTEDVGSTGGAEVEEGEGTGEGERESRKGASEGGRESGEDKAERGEKAGEGGEEESEERGEGTTEGSRGSSP